MVPLKTKLKPVLLNKKHAFKTSFSYFSTFSNILHGAAVLKNSEKLVFILPVYILSNPIQVKG
jgi:hypothetical protein